MKLADLWENVSTGFGSSWRPLAAGLIVGVILGAAGMYWLGPRQEVRTREYVSESMLLSGRVETKKEIVYVEKEPGEKTDVQIEAAKPQVTVAVNGKKYRFDVLSNEQHKFDSGKLVITEETKLKLDIKTPPPPRYTLGIGLGKNGLAGMAGGRIGEAPVGWWLYGDRRTVAGGVQIWLGR